MKCRFQDMQLVQLLYNFRVFSQISGGWPLFIDVVLVKIRVKRSNNPPQFRIKNQLLDISLRQYLTDQLEILSSHYSLRLSA